MCRINRHIGLATTIAENAQYHYQLGAVIVKGGKILSTGFNNMKGHAEWHAIRKANKTSGADIFVSRATATGVGMSKPCKKCMLTIRQAGIRRIYYTTRMGIRKLVV